MKSRIRKLIFETEPIYILERNWKFDELRKKLKKRKLKDFERGNF